MVEINERLNNDIVRAARPYRLLTVRQLYYRLIAINPAYRDRIGNALYRLVVKHCTFIRKENQAFDSKFVDYTRRIPEGEGRSKLLIIEKDSMRSIAEPLCKKHNVALLSLRGFGSLSQSNYSKKEIGSISTFLFAGDLDPSGLSIQASEERKLGHAFQRIAILPNQVKKYHLLGLPLKEGDPRTESFRKQYEDLGYEIESMSPRVLARIIEAALRR